MHEPLSLPLARSAVEYWRVRDALAAMRTSHPAFPPTAFEFAALLAFAVAASSAVPILLSPLTLLVAALVAVAVALPGLGCEHREILQDTHRRNAVDDDLPGLTAGAENDEFVALAGRNVSLGGGQQVLLAEAATLQHVLQRFGGTGGGGERRFARQRAARAKGRYLGIGMSNAVEATGLGPYEGVTLRISTTGKIAVFTGATRGSRCSGSPM